ncbi:MAG: hypothetical protein L3K01_05050 [Thermoplasmata archaeon]|nr:hypothetical protein [Thermoplasmata archaeon]
MSPKSAKAARKLRGAQKWILEELRALGPSVRLSTSQIAKKISKARGKAFHKNSVYNALRILVRRGHVTVVRDGHEKLYQSTGASRAESPAPNAAPAPSPKGSASVGEVSGAMLPHKLALGEILVVSMDAHQIVTATNLHGRLVLERHPLPG